MILLLEPDLSAYTDEQYQADLMLLPAQRYEKAMKYRFTEDRKRCVRAYMLLREGLRREYGYTDAPVFDFGPHGKPFLPDLPDVHFSLSHTGNAVLCALDDHPIGADIEMLRIRRMDHLLSILSSEEHEAVLQDPQPEHRFLEFWTRKESFLKFTGQGLPGIRALQEIPTVDTDTVCFETIICEADGFLYSVCRSKSNSSELPLNTSIQ